MTVTLTNAGKRFGYEWIFRGLTYCFQTGQRYALTGPNGCGKSTLMRVLSGHLSLSRGEIRFEEQGRALEVDAVYRRISMAAPYIELIEELSLSELLQFHERLRPFRGNLDAACLVELLHLRTARHKPLRLYSSGMKQRVRLALAICTDAPLLLLDEPTTNLDAEGVRWFADLLEAHSAERTVIVASNVEQDLQLCTHRLSVLDYKA